MRDFILTGEGIVEPAWIDENDHMNMMWYTHLVDLATQALLDRAQEQSSEDVATFVAARVTMSHRRELRLGNSWQIWSGFSDVSEKFFLIAHKITCGKAIVARCDMTIVPFSHQARTAQLFSRSMVDRALRFVIPGLAQDNKIINR